jgi:23S rRNA A1618 N6-methylase RlmF
MSGIGIFLMLIYVLPFPEGQIMYIILQTCNRTKSEIPTGNSIKGLDIGTGANLVYPLIAHKSYGWKMLGTDINEDSLKNARHILDQNPDLSSSIQLKQQPDS